MTEPETAGAPSPTAQNSSGPPATRDGTGSRDAATRLADAITPLLGIAQDHLTAQTVADLIHPDVIAVAEATGKTAENAQNLRISDLTGHRPTPRRQSRAAADAASKFYKTLKTRERYVADQRIVSGPKKTLEEVATKLKMSRQRVFQIERRIKSHLQRATGAELTILGASIQRYLRGDTTYPIALPAKTANEIIDRLLPGADPGSSLIRHAVISRLGWETNDGITYTTNRLAILQRFKDYAKQAADEAGIIDEKALIASLPDNRWRRCAHLLKKHSRIHTVDGLPSLKNTLTARVMAALINSPEPLTTSALAAIVKRDERTVTTILGNLNSTARTGSRRWAPANRVEHPYRSIANELAAKITAAGGTASVTKLITSIAKNSSARERSVELYLRTPRFKIKNGMAELAKPGEQTTTTNSRGRPRLRCARKTLLVDTNPPRTPQEDRNYRATARAGRGARLRRERSSNGYG